MKKIQFKFQKNLYPTWFPYPTSWLKAFVLALFLTISSVVFIFTHIFGYLVARLIQSPELLVIFAILAVLSPIPAIAFTHHLFHRLLAKFIPSIQAPEIGKPQGFWPGLISWWEGLFGWLVIALSTLISISILIFIMPLFDLDYGNIDDYYYYWHNYYWDYYYFNYRNELTLCIEVIWIICAAIIYQIEYLFKQKIIFSYANSNSKSSQPNPQLKESPESIETELNRLRGDLGLNQVKEVKKNSQSNNRIYGSNRKILSNKLIILPALFFLVVAGIYGFTNVLPSREAALSPSTISSAPPIVNSSATERAKPEIDSFQDAVNNALSAAKLTQTAKSKDDWNQVAEQWQKAIALMKLVPSSSTNYAVAQQKAVEYQRNIDYAQAAASNTP